MPHLQDPSALLANIVEFAPDALLVVDASGEIILVNRTAETLFGYARSELLGKRIDALVPARLREDHVRHRSNFAKQPHTREMGAAVSDLLATRKDGSEFPVEIRLSPVNAGASTVIAAAVRDVTDRRHAAQVLRAAQQEADRANQAKGRLLATASHDLRQPLQALQLLNAALLEQVVDAGPEHELITRQGEALSAMARLLNSLLDISRLEAGALKPEYETVSIPSLFGALQREFESLARARNLIFTTNAESSHIRTDPTLFRQLLENVLANSLKYTETGAIRLSSALEDHRLVIEVADSGVGIAAEQLGSIFDEYYQVKRARRQGVGLGLSIVKRIASLLEFALDVKSAPGEGTRFRIIIPAAQLLPAGPRQDAAKVAQPTRQSGALILLIEDDDSVRAATEFYLKTVGYRPITAANIAAAERAVADGARVPDLVITDYHLGQGETGLDAILRLRSKTSQPLPALMLSGDTSESIVQLAQSTGCRVLSKPVDVRVLVAEINNALTESGYRSSP